MISNNLSDVGLSLDQRIGIKVRVGCDLCNHDGVLGRVLAAETLMVDIDDQVKSMVAMNLSNNQKSLLDLAEQQDGFTLTSRKQSIKNLLQSGVIDDIIALETLRV